MKDKYESMKEDEYHDSVLGCLLTAAICVGAVTLIAILLIL